MTSELWNDPTRRAVTVYVDGTVAPDRDAHGLPLPDSSLLVAVNGASMTYVRGFGPWRPSSGRQLKLPHAKLAELLDQLGRVLLG